MWLLDSAVHAPVPAVNEPQYLGKARHLWDPSWAPGDFFLDSSNPHLVFYAAFGWLWHLMPAEAVAWTGRLVGDAVLAYGWTRLVRGVSGSSILAIPSAGIFLVFASIGNLSGEWIVGGIEGKVLAYGCLFAGLAAWLDGRLLRAMAWMGGAIAFHPVVGAWGLLAGVFAQIPSTLARGAGRPPTDPPHVARRTPISWKRRLAGIALLAAIASPGVLPALLTLGAPPEEAARATYMQVFVRLPHHLDPTTFRPAAWLGYALLLAGCLWAWRRKLAKGRGDPWRARRLWFARFVLATVLFALAGLAVGWHLGDPRQMPFAEARAFLLKFYPFRLADVFVPLAAALLLARGLCHGKAYATSQITRRSIAAGCVALGIALSIPATDANPSRLPPGRLADWIGVARWVGRETPPDSVIIVPTNSWGFRWYANRAVYVTRKDAPQDARGLLEWDRRLVRVRGWWQSSPNGVILREDLRQLGRKTGANYLVTRTSPWRFQAEASFDNGTYRVYRLLAHE